MNATDIILLILTIMLIVILCFTTYFFFIKKKPTATSEDNSRILEIQESIRNLSEDKLKSINEKSISLETLMKNNGLGMEEFKKTITEIKQQISDSLPGINQKTESIKNINDAVDKLSNIFISKSKRGSFGETQLNTILNDVFGSNENVWKPQYSIGQNNDRRVDAIIFLENEHKVAIDSKFPLENFNAYLSAINDGEKIIKGRALKEDIKKRIIEVEKYFDPKEKINSVIMFLPSEAIFITLCQDFPDIFDYARSKKITIATPTTITLIAFTIMDFNRNLNNYQNFDKKLEQLKSLSSEFIRWIERWEEFRIKFDDHSGKQKELLDKFQITTNKVEKKMKDISTSENQEIASLPLSDSPNEN